MTMASLMASMAYFALNRRNSNGNGNNNKSKGGKSLKTHIYVHNFTVNGSDTTHDKWKFYEKMPSWSH